MKWDTKLMAGRAASIATIWGVEKFLSSQRGKKAARAVDRKVTTAQKKTVASVRTGARNVRRNAVWAAAGAIAFAAAAALLGKAARRP